MPFQPRFMTAGLFTLAASAAALVVDLSHAHAGHHADSLIPILTSLYHWEPFFWSSDRNGQFLPLIASPCGHPFANLLIQFGLSVFAGIAALGLFARIIAPSCWLAVAAGAWMLFLFGYGDFIRFNMFNPCQPYAVSMFFAGAGLCLSFGARLSLMRWVISAAFFAAAGWVNVGIAMNLGPWLVFRWLFSGRGEAASARRTDCVYGIALLAIGTLGGIGLKQLSDYPGTPFTILPWEKWPDGWEGVAHDFKMFFGMNLKYSIGLLLLGVLWLIIPRSRPATAKFLMEGLAALAGLVAAFAFIGTTEMAANNGYTSRYLFPSLMLLNVAAAGAAIGPPHEWLGAAHQRCIGLVAAVLVAALPVTRYGWPSIQAARNALDTTKTIYVEDILDRRCTHVSGNYWDVWPAMFHANLALAVREESRMVWGIAPRDQPTRPQWSAVPESEVRLGYLVRQGQAELSPEAAGVLSHEFSHLRLIERSPSLLLYAKPPSSESGRKP